MSETAGIPDLLPLFPLPEAVLFPGAIMPLHVFEPRYLALVADALLGERVVAVPLLKPGYEQVYYTSAAPIHEIVGVGRIIDSAEFEDGTRNVTLRGEARVRVVEEFPGRPYRFARVELLASSCAAAPEEQAQLRQRLRAAVLDMFAGGEEAARRWRRIFESELDLGELTDFVAFGVPGSGALRQSLLAQTDSAARAQALLDHLHTLTALADSRRVHAARGHVNHN